MGVGLELGVGGGIRFGEGMVSERIKMISCRNIRLEIS